MPDRRTSTSAAGRAGLCLAAGLIVLACLVPIAFADGADVATVAPPAGSRLSAADPLNGGYLLVNMHGMLFHPLASDQQEDVAYARWLGSGVIRVFATDSTGQRQWGGAQVGNRIADLAPALRAQHERLIVAFVNNHRAVPGEDPGSAGWMDNYMQLLLPFYTTTWRGAYLQFVRDLIQTVQARSAQDVIFAWELGNELHTPRQPTAIESFITSAVAEVRALDATTPILPGTMGANHIDPGNAHSPIASWLYCQAPIDAYTLHAYDWVSRAQPGDMPIDWDLDNITSQPCPNGRKLPVIVEELGTSRALPGQYAATDEKGRLLQEMRQIQFVRSFAPVIGFGVWNGESPRLVDRTYVDTRRGLTSYGANSLGGGSCYDPIPDPAPGERCQLEQYFRNLDFVRVDSSAQWAPAQTLDTSTTQGSVGQTSDAQSPIVGQVDPVSTDPAAGSLAISGWVLDPSDGSTAGVDDVGVFLGPAGSDGVRLASAQLGLKRADAPPAAANPDWTNAGFTLNIPLVDVPGGTTTLTLAAHTPQHGTWLSTLQLVVPQLGAAAAPRPVAPPVPVVVAPLAPAALPQVTVQSPQPGDTVDRTFVAQVLAPGADRVDVFLEPDRDLGGRIVGSAAVSPSPSMSTSASASTSASSPGGLAASASGSALRVSVTLPTGHHTLYVHAHSPVAGQPDGVVTLPVVVS